MKIARFIANRIAQSKQKSFSGFILRLSFIATTLSVAIMIITLALATGFQKAIENKIVGFWGHMRIQEKQVDKAVGVREIPLLRNEILEKKIKQDPRVISIHPFVNQYALLKTQSSLEGVLIKGIDTGSHWNSYKQFLINGKLPKPQRTSFSREIILSAYHANRLHIQTGDSVVLYFTQPGQAPRARKVIIAGIYQTGIEEYDRLFALADLNLVAPMTGWETGQVGGYEIFLKDPSQAVQTANQLFDSDLLPATWDVLTTKDLAPQLFDWLNMQVVTRNVLLAFMTIVALVNLLTCLLVLVLERIPMIGILKAMGSTDQQIQQIFLQFGVLLTLGGIAAGTIIALVLLWIQNLTSFIRLDQAAYYIDTVAIEIVPTHVIGVMGGTLLISTVVLLLPTLLVKKISPLRAIRFN
ncbi:MAG: ABC transporter permease [Bacteroidetes bacterium]|nr:ABC transporter permease [Bacteroidota bacterium]